MKNTKRIIQIIRKISEIFEMYFVSNNEDDSYKCINNSFEIRRY